MYIVYSVLLAIGFVLALPFYVWKGRSTGKYLASFRERMGRFPAPLNVSGTPSIIFPDGRLVPGYLPPAELAKELGLPAK